MNYDMKATSLISFFAFLACTFCAVIFASPINFNFQPTLEGVSKSAKKECEKTGSCFVVGDIIVNREKSKNGSFETNSAVKNRAWKDGIVPYVIDGSITGRALQNVRAAIKDLNDLTCVTLRKKKNSDRGYININANEDGCFSWLGYTGSEQPVNIGDGCGIKGIVIHEIMHALGFYHEQSRDDRDEYVKVHFENIEEDNKSQFYKTSESTKEEVSYYGAPYNYESIMHYGPYAFTKNQEITIESLNNPNAHGDANKMGQRNGLTEEDIEEINAKYLTSKCKNKQ